MSAKIPPKIPNAIEPDANLLKAVKVMQDFAAERKVAPHVMELIQGYNQRVARSLKDVDPRLFRLDMAKIIKNHFVFSSSLIQNYRTTVSAGIPPALAAWYALRGTGVVYSGLAASYVARAGAVAPAGSAAAGKVLGAAAVGFAVGVSLDRAQEAVFGESYTAAGVKWFVEKPGIWGSAQSAPKELKDAWDKYFSWTDYPDQAIGWLKRKLG